MYKILMVNPPSPDGFYYYRDTNRSGRRSKANEIWPQAGLAQFASLYPKDRVRLIDCIAEQIPYSKLNQEMEEFHPDWVFFSPVSCTISSDMAVAYMAKRLGASTCAISPHLKALGKDEFPYLDHSVHQSRIGPEPEYQLREIITGESSSGTLFEELPPARQDLLPINRYSMPFIGKGYTAIIASRGCPYTCVYCRTTVQTERRIRYRKVESVIEEIEKYRLTNFILHGDTMTLNKEWIYGFCSGLRKLPFKVRIVSNSRVDCVNLDMLREMRSAGWWMISFGCESGDDRVLALNKKEAQVEDARQAVRWAKKAGLKVWGYFMLGMYGDTRESMERTLALSLSEPFDIVNFSISAPYPGTEWGRVAEENGWLVNRRWDAYDQNYSAQVDQPGCANDFVSWWQKHAYYKWYFSWRGMKFLISSFHPRYITYFLKTIAHHLI